MKYLKSVVSLFGGWPIGKYDYSDKLQSLDWIKMYIYMEKNWKVSTILDTGISINYMNTSQYILMVSVHTRVNILVYIHIFTNILTAAVNRLHGI